MKQKQDIREEAEFVGVDLAFVPVEVSVSEGQEISLDIIVNTYSFEISAISFLVSIDPDSFEFIDFLPSTALPVELSQGIFESGQARMAIGADCNINECYPFSGSAKVATIKLKTLSPGSFKIDLAGTEIASLNNESNTSGNLGSASISVEALQVEQTTSPTATASPISLFLEEPTESPTPTPTENTPSQLTEEPTPTPTETPTPTPISTPTETPSSTPTPSPIPTSTSSPTLPEAGISYPAILGIIIGILSITCSVLLIF